MVNATSWLKSIDYLLGDALSIIVYDDRRGVDAIQNPTETCDVLREEPRAIAAAGFNSRVNLSHHARECCQFS